MARCATEDEGEVRAPHAGDEADFLVAHWPVLSNLSDDTFGIGSVESATEGTAKFLQSLQLAEVAAFLRNYVYRLCIRDIIVLHFLHLTTANEDAYVIGVLILVSHALDDRFCLKACIEVVLGLICLVAFRIIELVPTFVFIHEKRLLTVLLHAVAREDMQVQHFLLVIPLQALLDLLVRLLTCLVVLVEQVDDVLIL